MRRYLVRLLYLFCGDCDGLIWPWQGRCGQRHTTCNHKAILALWRRNLEATGGPEGPWACNFCHKIPTEARP